MENAWEWEKLEAKKILKELNPLSLGDSSRPSTADDIGQRQSLKAHWSITTYCQQ